MGQLGRCVNEESGRGLFFFPFFFFLLRASAVSPSGSEGVRRTFFFLPLPPWGVAAPGSGGRSTVQVRPGTVDPVFFFPLFFLSPPSLFPVLAGRVTGGGGGGSPRANRRRPWRATEGRSAFFPFSPFPLFFPSFLCFSLLGREGRFPRGRKAPRGGFSGRTIGRPGFFFFFSFFFFFPFSAVRGGACFSAGSPPEDLVFFFCFPFLPFSFFPCSARCGAAGRQQRCRKFFLFSSSSSSEGEPRPPEWKEKDIRRFFSSPLSSLFFSSWR